jgi:hypothetical protein
VRYKDPRNYYMCYRQTGGSSVLRISRVVGGVERVLRSYALSNLAPGVLFTLGCRAEGTTVTLTLGAVKLAVSDATFSSGTLGVSVGYPVAGTGSASSHIADNFKATVQ